jgi:acetate kinase
MQLLIVNAGSSSLKVSVLDERDALLFDEELAVSPTAREARSAIEALLSRLPPVDAVAHRVVHGGPDFTGAIRLDASAEAQLAQLRDLAPLHNPQAIALIDLVGKLRPAWPQFACFDTSFHTTIPPAAATYAVSRAWTERWRLRRYGFHGLSHAWASRRAAALLGGSPEGLRIVSAHIGSGASLAAIVDGRSVDTTMGFTPLEGLVMATRSGSVDPGLLLWVIQQGGLTPAEVEQALESGSGLFGMTGTADLRAVIERADAGDEQAQLAYDVYRHHLVQHIAAMVASMGGCDALVYTGGAGFGSARLRRDVSPSLAYLGLELDEDANDGRADEDAVISAANSSLSALKVKAREDLEIARQVRHLVEQ